MKKTLLLISIVGIILSHSLSCYAQFNDKLSWSAVPVKQKGPVYDDGIKRSLDMPFARAYISENILLIEFLIPVDEANIIITRVSTNEIVCFENSALNTTVLIIPYAGNADEYQLEIVTEKLGILYGTFII